ncbi:MAG: FAD-dependent oxidoreductase [Chitinophagaceae bacterium]
MDRNSAIETLKSERHWDIIVVGGGSTGLGIAVDAAKRGFKTLLLEKYDFAKGTSSRSTKLVHGGVRYLAQGNIKLVVEALRERGFMLANAPHLTRVQHFVIPAYSYFLKWFYGIGLFLYDLLSRKLSLGHPALLTKKSVLKKMPTIQPKGLKGGILYTDGQFDDARMAIALAMTAYDLGATVVNYVQVTSLIKEYDKVVGLVAEDELKGELFSLKAKVVINATGVFADSILDMDDPDAPAMVMPSQGVHLVVEQNFFPGTDALMIPKTKDGRVLFALPWHGKVVIGTTDTALNIINEEPIALEEEIEFILMHFNEYATSKITRKDVLSVFAGLRPLVKTSNQTSTSLASRDHTIIVSKSNLITITGGKWTTYRKMAKDAVNNAAFVAKLPIVKCTTRKLKLHGYTNTLKYGDKFSAYGSDAELIQAMINERPELSKSIHPKYDYCHAELEFSVRNEMAMTVEDILARRSRLLFVDARAAIEAAPIVAQVMARLLKEDQHWEEEQVSTFLALANGYLAEKL